MSGSDDRDELLVRSRAARESGVSRRVVLAGLGATALLRSDPARADTAPPSRSSSLTGSSEASFSRHRRTKPSS